jgi:hypothetical protein
MSVGTTAAIIGGGIAAAGAVTSAVIGSGAAGAAGNAQYNAAQQQLAFAQQALQQQIQARASGISAAQSAAQMSPGEISNINTMLSTQTNSLSASLTNIQTMQGQLNAMSPQIQAAGQDYYNLLTGQASAILAPLQQQQQLQRNQLMNSLASTMGPGFMTSSAGLQALTTFDNNAALATNQAQMNAIQTVGSQYMASAGMQQQGQYSLGQQSMNAFGQSIATSGQAAGAYAQNTALQTNATLGAMSANPLNPFGVSSTAGAVTAAAPGQFAGQTAAAQGINSIAGGLGAAVNQQGQANMLNNYIQNQQNQLPYYGGMLAGQFPQSPMYGGAQPYAPVLPNISSLSGAANTGGYSGNFGAALNQFA